MAPLQRPQRDRSQTGRSRHADANSHTNPCCEKVTETMETMEIVEIGRDLLTTAMLLSAPSVMASLVVGLVISLMQTVTSV